MCLAKENMCSGSSVAQQKQYDNSISEQIPRLAPEQYLGPAVRLGQVDDDALLFRLQNRAHTNYIHTGVSPINSWLGLSSTVKPLQL